MPTEEFRVWRTGPEEQAPPSDPWLDQLFDAIDSHIGAMSQHLERVLVDEVQTVASTAMAQIYDRPPIGDRERSLAQFAFGEDERADRFLSRVGQEELDLLEAWYAAATAVRPTLRARARQLLLGR